VRYRVHFVHLLCNAPFDTTHVPSLQDPALLSPGQLEREAHPNAYQGSLGPRKKVRDVNMHVPWEGLALVREQLAGVLAARGTPAYNERRARGEAVNYLYGEGRQISPGPVWGW
jgi:hypothetical protein